MKRAGPETYRQYLPAIRTWGEFVIVQHSRGTSMNEICTILRKNGLSEAATDAVFATAGTGFYETEMRKKEGWRLAIVVLQFSATFLLSVEKPQSWWLFPVLIAGAFWQLGVYAGKISD